MDCAYAAVFCQNTTKANGNAEMWKKDTKYSCAEDGFSHGESNPVPLAEVCYFRYMVRNPVCKKKLIRRPEIEYADFTNGVTRTIWLLTNGARYFPVKCNSKDSAERLFQKCGLGGSGLASFEELTASAL